MALNIVAGLLYAVDVPIDWLGELRSYLLIIAIVPSCLFLLDAFRILNRVKRSNQAISKLLVSSLSISFFVYNSAVVFELFDEIYFDGK